MNIKEIRAKERALLEVGEKLKQDFLCLTTHAVDELESDDSYAILDSQMDKLYEGAFEWLSKKISVSQKHNGQLSKIKIFENLLVRFYISVINKILVKYFKYLI